MLLRVILPAVGMCVAEWDSRTSSLSLPNMHMLCNVPRHVQEVEDDGDDGGELDEEDLSCLDEDLLAAAADLLPALAASMGPAAYAPVFISTHAAPLLGRLKPQQPLGLRAIAAGAVAEVAEVLGAHMGGVVAQALPLLLRELQADDDINRQNAAYCAGLLVQASPEQAGPFLPQVLTALHTFFRGDEASGARDNATGAVGRIMLAVPQALPLGQVLPVYLGALPLQVGGSTGRGHGCG